MSSLSNQSNEDLAIDTAEQSLWQNDAPDFTDHVMRTRDSLYTPASQVAEGGQADNQQNEESQNQPEPSDEVGNEVISAKTIHQQQHDDQGDMMNQIPQSSSAAPPSKDQKFEMKIELVELLMKIQQSCQVKVALKVGEQFSCSSKKYQVDVPYSLFSSKWIEAQTEFEEDSFSKVIIFKKLDNDEASSYIQQLNSNQQNPFQKYTKQVTPEELKGLKQEVLSIELVIDNHILESKDILLNQFVDKSEVEHSVEFGSGNELSFKIELMEIVDDSNPLTSSSAQMKAVAAAGGDQGAAVARLQERIAMVEKLNSDLKEENLELRTHLAAIKVDHATLADLKAQADKDLKELQERYDIVSKNFNTVSSDLSILKDKLQIEPIKKQLIERNNRIKQLEEEISQVAKTRQNSFDLQAENQELKDRVAVLEKEIKDLRQSGALSNTLKKSQTLKKSNTRVATDLITPRAKKFSKLSTALNFENDEPTPINDKPVDKQEKAEHQAIEETKEEEPLAGLVSPQVQESDLLDSQSFSFMDSESEQDPLAKELLEAKQMFSRQKTQFKDKTDKQKKQIKILKSFLGFKKNVLARVRGIQVEDEEDPFVAAAIF